MNVHGSRCAVLAPLLKDHKVLHPLASIQFETPLYQFLNSALELLPHLSRQNMSLALDKMLLNLSLLSNVRFLLNA